jgi:DNA-binding transcriptional ArsR family regulator
VDNNISFNGIDGHELYHKEFEARPDIVQDIIPQGTLLLAGKPKSKKTWFCLDLALSVAQGSRMLEKYATLHGQVLYIDLEMGQRRVHERMRTMRRPPDPGQLIIVNQWPRVGGGCLEWLETWMTMHPYTRLIIVDTLIEIRPPRSRIEDPYQADKLLTQQLSSFCQRYQIAMVMVHHTRKARADDVMEEVSGTYGLIGGVDNYMVLAKSQNRQRGGIIYLGGRDIRMEDPVNITWEDHEARWIYYSSRPEDISQQQREIIDLLLEDPGLLPSQIGEKLGKPKPTIQSHLNRLRRTGMLVSEEGRYYPNVN